MKRITIAVAFMASMALHGATPEEARRIVTEYLDLRKRVRAISTSQERERYTQVCQEQKDLGYDAFPVYYGMLEEHFDDPYLVPQIMFEFFVTDGENLASEGKREALEWARKVEKACAAGTLFEESWAQMAYLQLKGDAGDLALFPHKEAATLLAARVAGTNVIYMDSHQTLYVCPSVTNTGPQGVYVYEIIKRAWEGMDKGTSRLTEDVRRYLANLPPELLTMVVSFDGDGNPVCNVDLAEYGLSMPVIEPRPNVNDVVLYWMKRTVTFPHDSDGRAPPQAVPGTDPPPADPPPPTEVEPPEDTPVENTTAPWRLPLLIAVLILGGTVALWRYLWKKGKS